MSLKVGIVGLPNVGKSTLFNALLKRQQALVANYPFATIEPNVGIVEVPDERLTKLAEIVKTEKIVYATVEFVDIAGLVKGAAEGAGLGNQFLSHIRECDIIVQLVRYFKDSEVVKEGSVDPVSDHSVITAELILKDLETVKKALEGKELKLPANAKQRLLVEKLYEGLNKGNKAREVLTPEELSEVKHLSLLSAKPELIVLNVGESEIKDFDVSRVGLPVDVVVSAKIEAELAGLSDEEAKAYLAEMGLVEPGLNRLIRKAYETLGKISFLTAGEKEVRAWTIDMGTKAPQAAGVIHTDFEKKFIKAKVVDYDDFVSFGGWKGASDAGKVRVEGRDYVMRDGDVVEFMIGT